MRIAIANFADSAAWYKRGQDRLGQTLRECAPECEHLFYSDAAQIGSPPHSEVPYAFKVYALWNAMCLGFDMAMYLDASVYPVKPMQPIFDMMEKDGLFIERLEEKHTLGIWCSDACLAGLGIDREVAMGIPCLIAGCVGFNFRNTKAKQLLADWLNKAKDGTSFKGAWVNDRLQVSEDLRVLGHRHDQSVLSGLVWQQQWPIHPFRTYVAYVNNMEMPESAIFNLNPA